MNQFRSKAFIKIKHSITSATTGSHLVSCRQMLENATSILTEDEIDILKDYLLHAWDRVNPVGYDYEEDSIESLWHKKICGFNHN